MVKNYSVFWIPEYKIQKPKCAIVIDQFTYSMRWVDNIYFYDGMKCELIK